MCVCIGLAEYKSRIIFILSHTLVRVQCPLQKLSFYLTTYQRHIFSKAQQPILIFVLKVIRTPIFVINP